MRPIAAACAVVILLTAWLYAPVVGYQFVNFDDPGYVTANSVVQRGITVDGVLWAFSTLDKANWHPLAWLSHMLDCELFGLAPGAHHLVSVAIHGATSLFLFGLLWSMTGDVGPSLLVAALFAVHPLHVESVAWISERKDVLSGFFWIATLFSYAGYTRRGGIGRYFGAWILLAAGLMTKPMLVTVPCVLLLLDVWPLGRTPLAPAARQGKPGARAATAATPWRQLVWEKAPFFGLSLAASVATLIAQRTGGAMADTPTLPLSARLANVSVAYVWYLQKALWPSGLAALYPHPSLGGGAGWGALRVATCTVLLCSISAYVVRVSRQKPHLIVGWLWYLGSLVPVIGLIQVGQQAMADRYSYLPLVGPFIALAWELRDLGRRRASWRGPLWIGATAAVGCYALAARAQLEHWRDGETVAQRAVSVTRDNYVMHYNLAYALFEKGEVERAIPHYAEAVRLQPRQASFHGNLAVALAQVDRVDEAVLHYRRALELAPTDAAAYNNLAWLLATHPEATRRRPAEALRLAEMAQRLAGDRPGILDTLAAAQAAAGQFQAATRTARMGVLLARKAGQESLARELERRLVFYERAQPYREHPGAAVFPLLQPSS